MSMAIYWLNSNTVVEAMLPKKTVETNGVDTVVVSAFENAVAGHRLVAGRGGVPAERRYSGVKEAGGQGKSNITGRSIS